MHASSHGRQKQHKQTNAWVLTFRAVIPLLFLRYCFFFSFLGWPMTHTFILIPFDASCNYSRCFCGRGMFPCRKYSFLPMLPMLKLISWSTWCEWGTMRHSHEVSLVSRSGELPVSCPFVTFQLTPCHMSQRNQLRPSLKLFCSPICQLSFNHALALGSRYSLFNY